MTTRRGSSARPERAAPKRPERAAPKRPERAAPTRKAALVFPDDVRPDFEGFPPAAFTFLRGIARHNERAWFEAQRDAYATAVKFPMECLVASFPRDGSLPVWGDPRRAIFRIHRDVRFANDKRPYKTHVGAVLSRTGGRGDTGILYIHIEPGASFVSSGFYMPEPPFLAAWRRRMVEDPDAFLAVARAFKRKPGGMTLGTREALKTLPQGFRDHADSPVAEFLRWKHFLIHRPVSDAEAAGPRLVAIIGRLGAAARPLLDYGWDVLTRVPR